MTFFWFFCLLFSSTLPKTIPFHFSNRSFWLFGFDIGYFSFIISKLLRSAKWKNEKKNSFWSGLVWEKIYFSEKFVQFWKVINFPPNVFNFGKSLMISLLTSFDTRIENGYFNQRNHGLSRINLIIWLNRRDKYKCVHHTKFVFFGCFTWYPSFSYGWEFSQDMLWNRKILQNPRP